MKKEVKSGIYCIEKIETGQRYIGKGKDLNRRLFHNHKGCRYIYNTLNKYGKDSFIRYVVKYCESDDLVYWEQYYIREWNTKVPNGYNLTDGGEGAINPTAETRKLLSDSHKNPSDKIRKQISKKMSGENNPHYGKTGEKSNNFGTKPWNALSKYYGIGKIYRGKYIYWRLRIKINRTDKSFGLFKTEIDAAKAYDKCVVEYNLSRPLNFPEDYLNYRGGGNAEYN